MQSRCRIRATSLHRSQIFRGFVSDAGSGRRILRLCRTILLLFGKKDLTTVCFDSAILNHALRWTRKRLFKSFLARNELVASNFA